MATQALPKPDALGAPLRIEPDTDSVRIGDSRVTLETVVGRFNCGDSPADIVAGFDTLSLADVYAVIAYYLRHREEVDAYLQAREEASERTWALIEADSKNQALRERLQAQRAAAR